MPLTLPQTIQNDAMTLGAIARDAGEQVFRREVDAFVAAGYSQSEAEVRASAMLQTREARTAAIESFRGDAPKAFLGADALREARRHGVVGVMKAVTRAQRNAAQAASVTQRVSAIVQRATR